ncbi:TetR/AcrR family transcriptional regulator [Geobacter sp. FeAm09]|uniref:TetR/AcrR family transcriptional regulator n=1 Tax=Geobacter sp. FeAm09 TaxID=2597769 RepID=UPI0011F05217|nr:TetR/AcrR family transcriptional regulator [Geobacter sp. FeAm09]QEM67328.1 TetR/AcrR family transcriptional regulator [Geobacter sp. FeAm09]
MGLKERRIQHKEQFRAEILAAARELFSQEGYSQFSMRKLAARIEHSPTTIYLYFRDKDDLLFYICEDLYASFLKAIVEIRQAEPDPGKALRLVLHQYILFGVSHPEHYKTVFFTSPVVYGSPDSFMTRDTVALRSYRAILELINDCMRCGVLKKCDDAMLAMVFWSAMHGLVASIIFTRDFPMPDTALMAETLIDGLLRGHAP